MRAVHYGVLGLLGVLLSGCATSGFLGFLATTGYVDTVLAEHVPQLEEASSVSAANAQQVQSLRADVVELTALKSELDALIADIEENKTSTAELQNLAVQVGNRLERLPIEMLRQLVTALTSYIESEG